MAEKVRQKLQITQVFDVKRIGDKGLQKLEFQCSDGKKWGTFSKSLFPYIKSNTEVDADTEIKEKDNYINRSVVEIYIDGKPMREQGQRGFSHAGKSPEELELSSHSFALSYAKGLVIAGKIGMEDILSTADDFYKWFKKDQGIQPPRLSNSNSESAQGNITPEQFKVINDWLKDSATKARVQELVRSFGWPIKNIKDLKKPQADQLIDAFNQKVVDKKPASSTTDNLWEADEIPDGQSDDE